MRSAFFTINRLLPECKVCGLKIKFAISFAEVKTLSTFAIPFEWNGVKRSAKELVDREKLR